MPITPCDLRARAASYRAGGPSSEHTAKMLEDAADEIERLRIQRDDLVSFLSGISRETENMARSYENT